MIYRYYRKPTTKSALQCVRRLIETGKLVPSEIVVLNWLLVSREFIDQVIDINQHGDNYRPNSLVI
ncbi:hypothetical protein J6TS7_29000 [Paenibacillus dendritiformis]|nr:hypothetical protein J6TS7_29000 [Paenibacillus dendritiformis]